MKVHPYLLGALLSCSCLASADKVDDVIKQEMARQNIPGVSLLITKDDKVVKRSAYGFADLELKVKMRPDMICETGSIGKTFTATVIMQLWEQGKIGLDDDLSRYIDNTPASWKSIKIRNLLGHTSGLPDYALVDGLRLDGQWTKEQWFAKMITLPLDFETGKQFAYSNSNYLLLGLIAEKIAGHPIDELRRDRIFKVAAMDHSQAATDQIVENRARGYYPVGKGVINGIKIIEGYGDGGQLNTCEDLAKFEKAFREAKFVKPETVTMMQASGRQANGRRTLYGFGWFDRQLFGHRFISHGGNTGGFGDSMTRVPEKNLTIIVMTNQANISGDGLAQKIAIAFDSSLAAKPAIESTDPDPNLSTELKTALVALANRTTTLPIYSEELTATLATGRGRMIIGQYAPFKDIASFAYCNAEPDDPDRILRYRVKTKDHSYIVGFWVTKGRKIYTVSVRPE